MGLLVLGCSGIYGENEVAADVAQPGTWRGEGVRLSFPGNWEQGPPERAPWTVSFRSPGACKVHVLVSEGVIAETEVPWDMHTRSAAKLKDSGTFNKYGAFAGQGESRSYDGRGLDMWGRTFLHSGSDGSFVVQETCYHKGKETLVRPGFDLIESSIEFDH